MKPESLIIHCKYYDGGERCPFKNGTMPSTFWGIEKEWVKLSADSSDVLDSSLDEYVIYGLGDYCEGDGVPLTLKAFLANRFFYHWGRIDIPEFKNFYNTYSQRQG